MRQPPRVSPLIAALFLVSCDGPAIDPSQSLVGAKDIPSARILSREIIEIDRGVGSWDGNGLAYDLRPDNELTVTITGWGDSVKAQESFQLSSDIAAPARRALWRLRPEKLGEHEAAYPDGCSSPPVHDGAEFTVIFSGPGTDPNASDPKVGSFDLPFSTYCNTKSAAEARQVIHTVLSSFPHSQVASEYERQLPRVIVPL